MKQLFATLAQGVSRHEYRGYIIQLTVDPWARKHGSVWEYSDGEKIRWGFKSKAECVDEIDAILLLDKWEVVFEWRHNHEGSRRFWYSDAIEFADTYKDKGMEVETDWVNRKILVK